MKTAAIAFLLSATICAAQVVAPSIRLRFDTVSALTNRTPFLNEVIETRGYYSVEDGGGATWRWSSGTTSAPAGYIGIARTNGMWLQKFDGDVRKAGLMPDTGAELTTTFSNLLSAVPAGTDLFLPRGRYHLDRVEFTNGVTIRGEPGTILVGTNVGANDIMLRFQPGYDWIETASAITQSLRSLAYNGYSPDTSVVTTVTMNNAALQFTRGEWYKLIADDRLPGHTREIVSGSDTQHMRIGEWVMSLSNSVGVLYTFPTYETNYATNIRVVKARNDQKFVVENIEFDEEATAFGNTNKYRLAYIQPELAYWPEFRGIKVKNANGRALRILGSVGATVQDCVFENQENTITTYNAVGYGVDDIGSSYTRVVNVRGRNLRHTFTTTGFPVSTNSTLAELYGASLFWTVQGCESVGASGSAFDTHVESAMGLFKDCVVRNPWVGNGTQGAGYSFRGRDLRIENCYQYGGLVAIVTSTSYGPAGGYVVDGLKAYDLRRQFWDGRIGQSDGGTYVRDVTFRNCYGEVNYGDGTTAVVDYPLYMTLDYEYATFEDCKFVTRGSVSPGAFMRWADNQPYTNGRVRLTNVEWESHTPAGTIFLINGGTSWEVENFRVRTTNSTAVTLIVNNVDTGVPTSFVVKNMQIDGTITTPESPNDDNTNYKIDAIWNGGSTRIATATATTSLRWPARRVLISLASTNADQTITLPPVSDYDPGDILFVTRTDSAAVQAILSRAGSDTINGNTTLWLPPLGSSVQLMANGLDQWHWSRDVVRAVRRVNGGFTVFSVDGAIIVDASGGPITGTMVATPGQAHERRDLVITKTDATTNHVTIDGNGKTINGAASMILSNQWQSVRLLYDVLGQTNWIAIP